MSAEPDFWVSDAGRIRLASGFFTNSARLMLANARELRQHLQRLDGPPLAMGLQDPFIEETQRLSFNAVSAAGALVRLTYRVLEVPVIAASEIPTENGEQTAVFKREPLNVVGELRNYLGHRALPPLLLHMSWEKGGTLVQRVVLSRTPLQEDKAASADVRDYLAALDDDLDWRVLVDDYFGAQVTWIRWLVARINSEFAAVLVGLDTRPEDLL